MELLFDPRHFRFPAGEQQHGRHKCDSLGEEEDSEAASDSEAEDAAEVGLQLGDSGGGDTGGWGGARHWFQVIPLIYLLSNFILTLNLLCRYNSVNAAPSLFKDVDDISKCN